MQSPYRYHMVQIPGHFAFSSKERSKASHLLQSMVEKYAVDGWEFFRMDPFDITIEPGCLGSLLGVGPTILRDYVVTFRAPMRSRDDALKSTS